jgi:excisionase family DNA binding protein
MIVERDETRERPGVDTAPAELPDRAPAALALVIDDPVLERVAGVGAEADPAGLVAKRELPELDEQVLAEVFALAPVELEPAAADDRGAEMLGVDDVPEFERANALSLPWQQAGHPRATSRTTKGRPSMSENVQTTSPAFLTPREVAALLRCRRQTVYDRISKGSIPAVRLDPNAPLLVPKAELLEALHREERP